MAMCARHALRQASTIRQKAGGLRWGAGKHDLQSEFGQTAQAGLECNDNRWSRNAHVEIAMACWPAGLGMIWAWLRLGARGLFVVHDVEAGGGWRLQLQVSLSPSAPRDIGGWHAVFSVFACSFSIW